MNRLRHSLLMAASACLLASSAFAQTYDPTANKAVTIVSPTGVPQGTPAAPLSTQIAIGGNVLAASNIAGSGNNSGFSAQGLKVDAILGLQNATPGNVDPARDAVGAAAQGNSGVGSLSVEEGGRTFTHIISSATTVVKAGKGFLRTIIVGTAGSAWSATIYDNTAGSGTVIAVVSANAQVALTFDAAFTTGLTIVTAGTTPGDITVMYR